MNTIKLSAVHYQMLLELAKKKHIKPVAYLEELIQEIFNSKSTLGGCIIEKKDGFFLISKEERVSVSPYQPSK